MRFGRPDVAGHMHWPPFDISHRILSLRPAGQSNALTEQRLRRKHQCAFWDNLPTS